MLARVLRANGFSLVDLEVVRDRGKFFIELSPLIFKIKEVYILYIILKILYVSFRCEINLCVFYGRINLTELCER